MLNAELRRATRLPLQLSGRWLIAVAVFATTACAHEGPYVWAQSVPPQTGVPAYQISDGDLLDIHVFNEERLSGRLRVRTDGRITLPLLGDVEARGKTPMALAAELQTRLQQFIKEPTVTIGIEEAHPIEVTVLGEVAHQGVFQLPQRSTVLEALATAGGFTEDADRDSIFVVRMQPPLRVRFTYRFLLSPNSGAAALFPLQGGDVVTVE